ncbi:tryptophan--tRNA ligase [Candidatus Wolfebacteria bacterium]|nr:tryptophan--tRNA ligase [Candidatus Wolfebacteria bacterium]
MKDIKNKIIFSAAQPSGNLHLGNYLGAIKQWIDLQNNYKSIFSIVDYHAITIYQEPQKLREKILETAMIYLAAGIDPKKSIIFVQSDVREHTELAWILNTISKISELELMTQYKDKVKKLRSNVSVGLFDYPVLMAADILLYKTDFVPVGEDQKQHIEFARMLARRFNNLYGEIFIEPKEIIIKEGARIMGLDDPEKKMSKSAENQNNYIALIDEPSLIKEKIKKAVTDSGKEIVYDLEKKKGIANLLTIYSLVSSKTIKQLEKEYKGKNYGEFKKDLGEAIVYFLDPLQKNLKKLKENPANVKKILKNGAEQAKIIASKNLEEAKNKIGINY